MKFVMVCMPAVGRGGVVVSALDFRSEGRWFEAQSLPSCQFFFFSDKKLYPSLSLSTQVYKWVPATF